MKTFKTIAPKILILSIFILVGAVYTGNVAEGSGLIRVCGYESKDDVGGLPDVTFATGYVTVATDVSMSGGYTGTVSKGGTISFTKSLFSSWTATGGAWDTPIMLTNDDWRVDTYDFYKGDYNHIGYVTPGSLYLVGLGGSGRGYINWVLDKHAYDDIKITSSDDDVIDCTAGDDLDCVAKSVGTATLTASIPTYVARQRSYIIHTWDSGVSIVFPKVFGGWFSDKDPRSYMVQYGAPANRCTIYNNRSGDPNTGSTYLKGVRIDGGSMSWTVAVVDNVPAVCGTAAKIYPGSATNYSGSFCSTGVSKGFIPPFPSAGNSASWTCSTGLSVNDRVCTAVHSNVVNGFCGAVNHAHLSSKPVSALCFQGNPTAVIGVGSPTDPWRWTCIGSGVGHTDSPLCTATKISSDGACGASDGGTYASRPNTNLCASVAPVFWIDPAASDGDWNWKCPETGFGAPAFCSANKLMPLSVGIRAVSTEQGPLTSGETVNVTDTIRFTPLNPTGGIPPYTYTWTGVDNRTGNYAEVNNLYSLGFGSHTENLKISDNYGTPPATASFNFNVQDTRIPQ